MKKAGKIYLGIVGGLVVVFFVIGLSMKLTGNATPSNNDKDSTVEVQLIDNLEDYSRLSSSELIEKIGEPVEKEDWVYQTGADSFSVTTYSYSLNDNYYEFLISDDSVVRLTVYSSQYWTNEGELFKYSKKDKSDILSLFGLNISESTEKKVDNGFTLKYSPFNDKVANVDIQDIDTDKKTFGFIKVTYDVRYFD